MTVATLLARQAGVISRSQALAAGYTPHAVDHRVRLRYWWPLHPRVYLVTGHVHTPEVAVRAAVLWGGEDAVLDGPAAAWWHGLLDEPPPVVGITRPRYLGRHGRPEVAVRRRDLHPPDVITLRGLAVTALPLTVLDTAVDLGGPAGADVLDGVLRRGLGGEQLQSTLARTAGGSGTAARMLAAAADRRAAAARIRLGRLLRDAGARGWLAELPVAGERVDIAFPHARVAVLVDAWAACPGSTAAGGLRRAGWTVLRFTAEEVRTRPGAVVRAIARALPATGARGTAGCRAATARPTGTVQPTGTLRT